MDAGWLPIVELRKAQLQAKNPHGCGFLAAQGIEAEILFAAGKKIGADSPVCRPQGGRCAQLVWIGGSLVSMARILRGFNKRRLVWL
jgi:hypothetical protein